MSKHNYTQYSNKKKNNNGNYKSVESSITDVDENTIPETEVEVVPEVKMVNETVETVSLPKIVTGKVSNCAKLNVRVQPAVDADIVCILNTASEIEINVNESTAEWLKICTAAGVDGYCMRKFVDARL